VVSGSYNLKEYSPNYIVLERRDDYWGNAALHNGKPPSPKYIVHPIFRSNGQLTFALKEGNLDYSMSFETYIWNYERMGVHTWYKDSPYQVSAAMAMLMVNTTKKPLNDRRFRRALATAIDYSAIRMFSLGGYSTQLQPGLIVPTSIEGEFINKEDAQKYGVNLSLSSEKKRIKVVKKMLAEAGYKSVYKEDGSLDYMEDSLGNRVPTLYITSPAGWSDWESMVIVAVDGMRAAGIDVREKFVDGSEYWPAMGVGNFDLIMHKPAADVSPSLPWSRFNEVMSSRDWKPVGEWAGTNIGRYNRLGSDDYRPEVDSLLAKIPLMTDSEEIAEAYRELNRIFMEDQPAIPLAYVPEQFYEYSDKVWTNWPNEKNPYASPQMPGLGTGTNILWNIRPR
jgi:peptide/nickel transport system substrate-binding protein